MSRVHVGAMKCPKCDGNGEMPVTAYEGEQQFAAIINCDRCSGTGEQPVHTELCPKASITLYDEEYHPECMCALLAADCR